MARVVVIAAAQLSAERARMREESPRAWRPIEAGELHRAGVGWPPRLSGALGTFGAAPRPHRVRRLRAR
jgi:hypothetical protein